MEVKEVDVEGMDLGTLANNEIDKTALYEHLAEESVELAQAALKLVRCIRGENPTSTTYNEAMENLIEEYTDVRLVADVVGLRISGEVYSQKEKRWADRILSKQPVA